jgi:hypothetical protein
LGVTMDCLGAGSSGLFESKAKNSSQLLSTTPISLPRSRMEGLLELSGDRKGSVFAVAICLSMTLSLYFGGVMVTPAITPALKFVRCPPPDGDNPICTPPFSAWPAPAGDFIASFHCCTLLTASSNLVRSSVLVVLLGFLVFVPAIQGCLRSFRAETRRLGSFWKHWRRKSRTAGDAPSGRGGCSSFTMRNRAGMGSSLWYGGRPSSNSRPVQPTLLFISQHNVEGGGPDI